MPRSPASPGIFISYRRADSSGFAGRLYDRLSQRFGTGRVFMDIDTIHPGHEFAADIERALSECVACIVLIGRDWESIALPDGRRRLEDPTDFVRLEIAAAIRRGVAVFPVLVDGATPPSAASLPEEIRDVAGRQAIELSNERWNYDVGRLLLALDEVIGQRRHRLWPRPGPGKLPAILVGAAILLSVLGIGGWLATRGTTASNTGPTISAPTTAASSSAEPLQAPQLSGTYDAHLSLVTFTKNTLGANNLWGEPHPVEGDTGDHWNSQRWVLSSTSSGTLWEVPSIHKALIVTGANGKYVANDPHRCLDGSPGTTNYRTLDVSSSKTDTDGSLASFTGHLTISWTCERHFTARFSFYAKRSS